MHLKSSRLKSLRTTSIFMAASILLTLSFIASTKAIAKPVAQSQNNDWLLGEPLLIPANYDAKISEHSVTEKAPGATVNPAFYLLCIPMNVPVGLKFNRLHFTISISGTDPILEKTHSEEANNSLRIASIYPTHQFLNAQFSHTGSISGTASPSYAGVSAGSLTLSSSDTTSYLLQIPRCIGAYANHSKVATAEWEFLSTKKQAIVVGRTNVYCLLHDSRGLSKPVWIKASMSGDKLRQSSETICQVKDYADFSTYVQMHAGELDDEAISVLRCFFYPPELKPPIKADDKSS
jgi:hypothetical protein